MGSFWWKKTNHQENGIYLIGNIPHGSTDQLDEQEQKNPRHLRKMTDIMVMWRPQGATSVAKWLHKIVYKRYGHCRQLLLEIASPTVASAQPTAVHIKQIKYKKAGYRPNINKSNVRLCGQTFNPSDVKCTAVAWLSDAVRQASLPVCKLMPEQMVGARLTVKNTSSSMGPMQPYCTTWRLVWCVPPDQGRYLMPTAWQQHHQHPCGWHLLHKYRNVLSEWKFEMH